MLRCAVRLASCRFCVVGGPLRMISSGTEISSEQLRTETSSGEPMIIHAVSGYVSALYLVEYCEASEFLLLDPGAGYDYHRIQCYIQHLQARRGRSNVSFSDLKLVLLSHYHQEQGTLLEQYAAQGTRVMVPHRYERYYSGISGLALYWLEFCRMHRLSKLFKRQKYECTRGPRVLRTPAIMQLRDGQAIPCFEDWSVIHSPGHTMHMCAFFHTPSHILYLADALPFGDDATSACSALHSPMAFSHTVHRLRRLPVQFLLTAHDGMLEVEDFGGWDALLDNIVDHYRKNEGSDGSLLSRLRSSLSPEVRMFIRDDLPRGPLPLVRHPHVPAVHLK